MLFPIYNVKFCLWCNWAHQGDCLSLDTPSTGRPQPWGAAALQHLILELRAPLPSEDIPPPPFASRLPPVCASVTQICNEVLINTTGQKMDAWSVDVRPYVLLFRKALF